jgi:hypothetical protein
MPHPGQWQFAMKISFQLPATEYLPASVFVFLGVLSALAAY